MIVAARSDDRGRGCCSRSERSEVIRRWLMIIPARSDGLGDCFTERMTVIGNPTEGRVKQPLCMSTPRRIAAGQLQSEVILRDCFAARMIRC